VSAPSPAPARTSQGMDGRIIAAIRRHCTVVSKTFIVLGDEFLLTVFEVASWIATSSDEHYDIDTSDGHAATGMERSE